MHKIIINNPAYPFESWIKILSVEELIEFVKNEGLPDFVSFDSDLEEEEISYECAKWLVNFCKIKNMPLPPFAIYTQNQLKQQKIQLIFDNHLHSKPLCVFGLGGGGCNALELFIRSNVKAEFTFITSPIRHGFEKNFMEIKSPYDAWYSKTEKNLPIENYRFKKSYDSILKQYELPNQLKFIFNPHEKYIFLCAMGGYTGTLLIEKISEYLSESNVDFEFILSIPANFEDVERQNIAMTIQDKFKKDSRYHFFHLEDIKTKFHNNLSYTKLFDEADKEFLRIFESDIIKKDLT